MSHSMRWRYGETNPVMLPVQAGTVVEIGDLVYLESGHAYPASNQTDQGQFASQPTDLARQLSRCRDAMHQRRHDRDDSRRDEWRV